MRKKKGIPYHASLQIGLLLAVVGGFLDAYTYLLRGRVFANAQTGNMVLLGVELAQRNFVRALYYLIPISAFALGVFATELIKRNFQPRAFLRWQHAIVLVELLTLFLLGLLPASVPHAYVNVTISFVCSLQVCSFKTLIDTPYATTMCTGNLRSAAEHLFLFMAEKDRQAGKKAARYLCVLLFFCVGAATGAFLCAVFQERSIWFCCGVLLWVFCSMPRYERTTLQQGQQADK